MRRAIICYKARGLGNGGSMLPWSVREPTRRDGKLGNVWSRWMRHLGRAAWCITTSGGVCTEKSLLRSETWRDA